MKSPREDKGRSPGLLLRLDGAAINTEQEVHCRIVNGAQKVLFQRKADRY